ncbi:MAG: fimbrillin family protein [Bacteroidales bacterium]|nr:fimbrillin family protein [Bacteroidales bacterium]
MKTTTTLAVMAVALAAISSCSNDHENSVQPAAKYITVNTSIGRMTRVATDADGSQHFEADDQISVYAWTGKATEFDFNSLVVNNSINTYNGKTWTASPQMLWADQGSEHYFIGIHPAKTQIASAVTDLTADSYTLDATNQAASDLLVATNLKGWSATTAPGGMVDLEFDHVMAKLIVNLKFRTQWGSTPTVQSVTAQNAATTATVNYLEKTVTADGAAKENISLTALATPQADNALSYASIMVPQSGFHTIIIRIGGKDYTYTHSGDIKLESGKYTTVDLIVGRDRIELGDVTVNDWQKGDVIDGGEAVD